MDATEAFQAAARGDAEAQRFMANRAIEAVKAGEIPPRDGLLEALHYSRMACSNGALAARDVAALLLALADLARGLGEDWSLATYEGEAAALLEMCADAGDAEAADILIQVSLKATEAGMRQAQVLARYAREPKGDNDGSVEEEN